MSNKLALCMIVKAVDEEAAHLEKCLRSIGKHVDGIYLYLNHKDPKKASQKVIDVAKRFTNNYIVEKWTNFGEARNNNFSMVPKDFDWIVWLDSDDTVKNPQGIKKIIANASETISGIYMAYEYQHDEYGNVTVEHYVARVVRNNGAFKWTNKILHETLEPVRNCGKALNTEVKVIHHADDVRRDESLARNVELLEKELQKEGETPDPRTLYYLGSTYIDTGNLDGAKELLLQYLQLSGWPEERAQAWINLGNIYDIQEDDRQMREAYLHALYENPADPLPYVELGKCEMRNELWQKAIVWLEMGVIKKTDPTTTVNSSTGTKYRAYMYLSECNLQLGGRNIETALKWADLAFKMRPDKVTQDHRMLLKKLLKQRDETEGAVEQLVKLAKAKKGTEILAYIATLPEHMQDNPAILRFKKSFTEPRVWPKDSMVIFCGNSVLGNWGPWSLDEGIGGSEEAVIRLSKHFVKQGWKVTVYCTPNERAGTYDGVEYRNYWEASLADTYDVFVSWRAPWFFDAKIKARKKYLWLHDVMPEEEFTQERLANLDKVIVLSKYHRSLFPKIPDNKIFLSANGIDPEDFEKEDSKHQRNPHRLIYMSSHVRGLRLIYEIWEDVKKRVPAATLDIYYGWKSFVNVNRDNPERMEWKQMMEEWERKLDGVTDHGKISQKKIVEEIFKSGIWVYPCPFPEIYAITAVKAQAGGAVPVSSNFAALDETVQYGVKIPMKQMNEKASFGDWNKDELNKFKNALIDLLENPDKQEAIRSEMMTWARTQSWQNVCKQWIGEFND